MRSTGECAARGDVLKVVAIHGLPTSPRLWERIEVPDDCDFQTPEVLGLGKEGTPLNWSLESCVEQLNPMAESADVVIGHDLGGVLAAMLARPGQTVVLSGTALANYWLGIRLTALPLLQQVFYQRHGGRHFLRKGSLPEHRDGLLTAFSDHGDDWPDRMRRIAQAMRPPAGLAQGLKGCQVHLFWGKSDPWYPAWVAHSIRRVSRGQLHWLDSGHFTPWEAAPQFSRLLREEVFG